MYIGSAFAFVFFIIWMYTLTLTLYRKAEAYIHGRPALRNNYLRLLIPNFTDGKPVSMYSDDRRKYSDAGLDHTLALTGENVAGIIFVGFCIVVSTLLLWPISLTVLGLRGLRRYNTDEEFHALFEQEVKPAKIKIPKPHPREKFIKGLE